MENHQAGKNHQGIKYRENNKKDFRKKIHYLVNGSRMSTTS